jgi:parvulin-like peptidyl-prolyl isomerase
MVVWLASSTCAFKLAEQTSHGIVGPVPLTQAHPLLAEKLRTVAAGTLLEPFSIEQWWLVVRPERLIAASFDEAMANQMARELFDQWVADEVTLKLRLLAAPEAVIPAL